jgi:shikimate dehydrogenase
VTTTQNRAAVLGSPISHSISPALHQAAYDELGLIDWTYERLERDEFTFPGWFRQLGDEWRGLSLTMPLKEVAAGLADRLSPSASTTGAANTITWVDDGSGRTAVGDNTDVHGIVEALRAAGTDRIHAACVLGAGATARSAVAALGQLGAERITLLARSQERSRQALDLAAAAGIDAAWAPLHRLDLLGGADAVVSALPIGAADLLAQSLRDGGLDGNPFSGEAGILLDVVYLAWPTPLGGAWEAAGGLAVSGFDMLLHQAAAQVRLMTGLEPPIEAMRKAGLTALG